MIKIDNVGGSSGLAISSTAITGGTDKRVLFDDNGVLGEDAALIFDKTNKRLAINAAATATFNAISTTEQMRIGYDANNYWKTTISSVGNASFDLVGTSPAFSFLDPVAVGKTWDEGGLQLRYGTVPTLIIDSSSSTAQTNFELRQGNTQRWAFYVPASSVDFRFYNYEIGEDAMTMVGTTGQIKFKHQLNLASIAAVTNSGDLWNDSTQNTLAYYNGNTLYQGGNLYTATADATLNSATPTTAFSATKIGTTTIKASTLKVGQKFSIWGAGYYSTPIGNTATVTITTKIGATTVSTVTTGIFPASATNLPFDFILNFTVRTTGATGTLVADGTFNYATALTAVAKTSNSLSTIGTITFDSTADKAMDVLVSWSAVTTQTATVQQSKIDFL